MCGIVEQSALPDEDTPIEEIRRWSAANEMMPSIAKGDPRYQPLADTLDKALRQWQRLDLPAMREEIDHARALCTGY